MTDTEQEQDDMDRNDEDSFREQAIEALMSLGSPLDEAENQFEDMFGY